MVGTVDLPSLVEDSLYTYNELFRHEGLEVSYSPPRGYPPHPGDPERLAQVFLNILDNACKYGRSGKRIEVAIRQGASSVSVTIRDHGPGDPAGGAAPGEKQVLQRLVPGARQRYRPWLCAMRSSTATTAALLWPTPLAAAFWSR